ncbi:MAG: sulfurtransferase TusA family protein [Proteobacteria bacterium]|nr:sulfurtransferase TusA family protein [Pseudomonadota bacterium]
MNTESIIYAFEINVCHLKRSMPMVAVGQSLNTLITGDVLRINACNQKATRILSDYCSNVGHTLLQHVEIGENITLYIRKN